MQDLFELASNGVSYKQLKISDLLFTEYKCLAQSSVFDVWSPQNYFVHVIAGKLKWVTPKEEYLLHAGETAFVKKGGTIIQKYFDKDFCCLLIFMPDDYIKTVARLQLDAFTKVKDTGTDSVTPIPLDGTLHTYFQSLSSYFFNPKAPSPLLLELKFRELLLNIISSGYCAGLSAYFKSLFYSSKTSIREVMEANYTYNLSLEEFAKLCDRSLSAFKKDFKEIYDCSPGRWLTEKRLEYARNLLINSDKSINELLFECGFENASHFTKVFKVKFGTTPAKLRG